MKFTVSGDLRQNAPLRLMLSAFLFITLLFDLLSVMLAWEKGEMDPTALKMAILGSEELFMEPMMLADILTGMHLSLFLYTFVLLMLFALSLRLDNAVSKQQVWIGLGFGSLLLDQLGMLLIRYGSGEWAFLKITAFFSLHAVILLVSLRSLYLLWRRG